MEKLDLKIFICKYLLKSNGNLCARSKKWIIKHNFDMYEAILAATSFLRNGVFLRERVYCIFHNLIEAKKCIICGKFTRFCSFKIGYSRTCSNRKCVTEYIRKTNENGKSIAKIRAENAAETMKKIKNDGTTIYQKAGLKAKKTKRENIINSLNVFQRAGKKAIVKKRKAQENGLNIFQSATIKAGKTKTNTFVNGISISKLAGVKAAKTKISRIDENGLNSFDRAFISGFKMKKHPNVNLYYQGANERDFIDKMIDYDMLVNLKRASSFKYFVNNIQKFYHPDFQIDNNVFEIKTKYTYDYSGNDLNLRTINNLKWKSVIAANFNLVIVWEKNNLMKLDNSFDLNQNLFDKNKFLEFNKENLLKLLNEKEQMEENYETRGAYGHYRCCYQRS